MQKFIKQNKLLSAVMALGIVAVLFLYLGPQDTTTTMHTTVRTASRQATAQETVEDDYDVHFPAYKGTSRDPFIPAVVIDNPTTGGPGSLVNGGKWQLTGINEVNGVVSALIENTSTSQSVYLEKGNVWNGLRVASITDDAVNFVNALGQVTQMGFADPSAPDAAGDSALAVGVPSDTQINPLPPLTPVVGNQPSNSIRRNRRQQSDDQESQTND